MEVPSRRLDYNGHVTEESYLQLSGLALGKLFSYIGHDADYRAKSGSYYTVETHMCHLGELHAGDRAEVFTQVLGVDDKRLHLFYVIRREGDENPAATIEQMLIHVDATSKHGGPVKGNVRHRLFELARLHAQLPRPERAGSSIHMPLSSSSSPK
ncbi:thioesterase family protein [Bradyrhizobium sp. CAR08]